jgi:hypothetical protein
MKCNRKNVFSVVPSGLSIRSGGICLDIDCGTLCTDFWPNFQLENAVSRLK